MSRRNRRDAKKIRTLSRALRKGRVDSYIDLVQWLKLRGHAQTTGEAHRLILSKRVMADSHPLGLQAHSSVNDAGDLVTRELFQPLVRARLRDSIHVTSAVSG